MKPKTKYPVAKEVNSVPFFHPYFNIDDEGKWYYFWLIWSILYWMCFGICIYICLHWCIRVASSAWQSLKKHFCLVFDYYSHKILRCLFACSVQCWTSEELFKPCDVNSQNSQAKHKNKTTSGGAVLEFPIQCCEWIVWASKYAIEYYVKIFGLAQIFGAAIKILWTIPKATNMSQSFAIIETNTLSNFAKLPNKNYNSTTNFQKFIPCFKTS